MQRSACRLAAVVCLVGGAFLAEPRGNPVVSGFSRTSGPSKGGRHDGSVADADTEVRRALESGEYDQAERLAVEWHSRVQSARGPDSIELARASDLLVEALLENGKA